MSDGQNRNEFDADYVKKLRDEAATWRTKYRELEGQVAYTQVDAELARRGVKADPTWVSIGEGQSISEAVDTLIEKHPHLKSAEAPTTNAPDPQKENVTSSVGPIRITAPNAMPGNQPNTNSPGADASGLLKERTFGEIKKDPVARARLRELYRGLIAESSNQGTNPEY